jgi:predicted nucleic acid-binding protein
MLVTEYVLWECVNFLSRPPHRASAHAIVHWALSDSVWLPASPTLLEAGLALHRTRPDKEWSLTDCVSFHVMGERGERGLTGALAYDGHFEQAGFEALLRLDPPNHGRA